MGPDIKNFSQIEKLIRENPRQADAQAFEWQQFLKTNAESSPELYSIESSEEFYQWAKDHPEKNIDPSVWVGKEIADSYSYLRDQHEDQQMQAEGSVDQSNIPGGLAATPILAAAFLQKPKIMEDDRAYQKIEEKLEKEWLKSHNAKDFSSQEGIDYLYGSLDDKTKLSLSAEAEAVFRKNPKFKKRLERYDKEHGKIYKNYNNDPRVQRYENITQMEINARLALLEKIKGKKTEISDEAEESLQKYIKERVHRKSLREFADKYEKKTKLYHERIRDEKNRREEKEVKSNQFSSNLGRILEKIRNGESRESTVGNFPSLRQGLENSFGRAQKGASSAARAGSRAAAQAGRAAAQVGKMAGQAAVRGGVALFASGGWIVVVVIVAIVAVVFIIVLLNGKNRGSIQQAPTMETVTNANLLPTTSPSLPQ